MWALGIGEAHVKTLNASGATELLTLRSALYVSDVKQVLISCSALLKDCYKIILPSSMAFFPADIHNGELLALRRIQSFPFFRSALYSISRLSSQSSATLIMRTRRRRPVPKLSPCVPSAGPACLRR